MQHHVYSAFGNLVRIEDGNGADVTAAPILTPFFTYANREYDVESGLYHSRARTYDASIGRFLQEDPFRGVLSSPLSVVNKYIYVLNNPNSYVDPSGKFLTALIVGAVVGAIIGGIAASIENPGDSDALFEGILEGAIVGAIYGGLAFASPTSVSLALGLSLVTALLTRGNVVVNFRNNVRDATVGKAGALLSGNLAEFFFGQNSTFLGGAAIFLGIVAAFKDTQDASCNNETATDFARQNVCLDN